MDDAQQAEPAGNAILADNENVNLDAPMDQEDEVGTKFFILIAWLPQAVPHAS